MPSSRIPHPLSDKENIADHAVDVIIVEELDEILDEPPDPVTQEDGYLSPSPSYFRSATPDISSPVRPYNSARHDHGDGDDFGADIIPSPTAVRRLTRHTSHQGLLPKKEKVNILVRETPPPINGIGSADEIDGPDLRDVLDIDDDIITPASSSSTPGPITPEDNGTNDEFDIDESVEEDIATEASARAKRTEIVANGWWNKWALNKELHTSKTTMLRRCETTITADGRQSGCRTRLGSAPPKVRFPLSTEVASRAGRTLKAVGGKGIRSSPQFVIGKSSGLGQGEQQEKIGSEPEQFRCVNCHYRKVH
ncbi:hypothetical protein DEU56DRAFT_254313 [Suillus clintonianus]|uniref:uncharacterized protein n=1 Tax=Suillus clintonianus TaxID=1904413 RepID=UPI001B868553|nr:uncharacterized protein DEU56DRAFT_254313 [Suillus clintonianus]KAG2143027.1 hypothetical protein DEU56DRAFT_254313 [Suillus clintonianus]